MAVATGSGITDIFLLRNALYNRMKESGYRKLDDQIAVLKEFLRNETKCPDNILPELHKKISHFITDFKKRWTKANRITERFLNQNREWLQTSISFPNYSSVKKQVGRPQANFNVIAERTKRKKTEDLRSHHSTEELCYAAQMSLRSWKKVVASKVVKEITSTSPTRAKKYAVAFRKVETMKRVKLAPEDALSMYIEAKLTRHQYNVVRSKDKLVFPSYKVIQLAKKDCYPNKDAITVNEISAEVKLQELLNHTVSRLVESQRQVIESQENFHNLHLITKWGFDGSSGHSRYKQRLHSPSEDDASVFLTSLVPLRLISGDPEGHHVILWQNPRSSSTRFCRPIRFQFKHETSEIAKKEKEYMDQQIQSLVPSTIELTKLNIKINHILLFTMIDGKICNSITETTSTQKCYICGLTSKSFNKIADVLKTPIKSSTLDFGLSVLQARIRFFECLLHIAYKLPLKQWQVRGDTNKQIVEKQKKTIQSQFRLKLGLIVDQPKPGFGNSNDGQARRFFDNADISATITGIDIEIIKRFRTILTAISSGYKINVDVFELYALDTAKIYVNKYSWYPMPPTVHKILFHGSNIIEKALLPIGLLSEEAQEARNKDFKKYRENYSRKISRVKANEDVLNYLLISSDPLLSSMQQIQRKHYKIEEDVLKLLEAPTISSKPPESETDDSSSSSCE